MKEYNSGIPIRIRDENDKRYYGVTLPEQHNGRKYYYRQENNMHYYAPENVDSFSVVKDNTALLMCNLYAKILDYHESSQAFGDRHRKQDCVGAVLRAVGYTNNENTAFKDAYTLQTARIDGVQLMFFRNDLRLIYPTIHYDGYEPEEYLIGDKVVVIKSDISKTLMPGQKGHIVSVIKNGQSPEFDVLICKIDGKEASGYAKHFKRLKK